MYIETTATKKIKQLKRRIQGIAGGTSASKTISVILKLTDLAQSDETPTLTSIVSESMPHLKRGAIRDFLNIMIAHKMFDQDRWNKSDFTYTFANGSKIEFFSADSPDKVRGPRRDRLFINEGNNISWQAADQLMVRTRELIIIDWNPTNEFWWYTEVMPHRDVDFITVTYKDNEALDPEIVADIEAHKHNKNWWRVFGEGLLGEAAGRIYTGWAFLEEIPHEARLERRGMDFGFTNDPTTLIDIHRWNNSLILDEQMYRKGMKNRQIAAFVNVLPEPNTLIVADSANPKDIDELRTDYNLPIIGAVKKGVGKGPNENYVNYGIQKVQDQMIFVTTRSTNLIKEYRNYMWLKDPMNDERHLNTPEDAWNHCLDAVRYAIESMNPDEEEPDLRIKTGNVDALIY
jgi:phage terminase large subunit